MPSKDKRKLAAIMFADVVGYSRMMASNEEQTLELLKDFENICSPIISKHDGEIIKKVGDELFCEFSSAKQAVDSALAIQEAIQPYNDSRPKDFKLQVRIGIHVGDIVLRDGDVFGDGVNVASRIQPFASPGGICISSSVKEAVSSHPNYNIISEGQQELKNIIEKHALYRVETGYEDEIIHIKKPTISKNRIFIITSVILLLGIIGYNGFKYYKMYSDLQSLMSKNIDLGDDRIILLDKIFSTETLIIAEVLKSVFSKQYSNISVKEISDSSLTNIYNTLLSSVSWELPKSMTLLNNHSLNDYFETKGELKPYYDARIETQFALEYNNKNYIKVAQEQKDSSTTDIMVKSNANIGFFPFLFEVNKPHNDNKYLYIIEAKLINHDTGGMSMGFTHNLTSEQRLTNDMTDWIIKEIISIENKDIIGKVIQVNQTKVMFQYCNECSDLIEKNYIISAKRKYIGTDEKLNDLIEAELKIIEAQDTTSKWYKEFYYHQFSEWSLSEISRIRNDYYNSGGGSSLSFTQPIPIKLQVTETFDSTGVAIIYEQENPYINIKVGDLLYIK